MSDFEFDADVVAGLTGGLTTAAAGVHRDTTLTAPDTGATTADTVDGLQTLSSMSAALATALTELATDIDRCVAIYGESDEW